MSRDGAFKISRKKNDKFFQDLKISADSTDSHYESVELAKIWENFKLLACKRQTCQFSKLKLILNL